MKKIFTLFILFSFHLSKAQHYTQGVAFDSLLWEGYYQQIQGCTQMSEVNIDLDPSLFNYVSGLQFMVIRDSIQSGMPGSTPSPIGDTTILDSTHPTFSAPGGGYKLWFRIKLAGTPTLAGQTYPCNFVLNQCTCFCLNLSITSAPGSPTCMVDMAQAVAEHDKPVLSVFPNPATSTFSVNGITGKTGLRLYDPFGRLVMEQEADENSTLNTESLTQGIYTLSVDDGKTKTFTKVLVAR